MFRLEQIEVMADFLIERVIGGARSDTRPDAPQRGANAHDEDSPSIRLIIATVFAHRSASIASCFRPARVIE